MKYLLPAIVIGLLFSPLLQAQGYRAIQGSSEAGALGVHNNPAAIVNTPFTWDVAVAGVQLTTSTNAFSIRNYSLLSNPASSLYHVDDGQYKRSARLEFNVNLLNARISLSRKSAVAFGLVLRSNTNLSTSSYNYSDTLHNTGEFLKINQDLRILNGSLLSSSWLEGYLSYARTIKDNEVSRLNAGFSLHAGRGLSGASALINNVTLGQQVQNNQPVFSINSADISYGYSGNYDHLQAGRSAGTNTNDFLNYTSGGASLDAGIEYLIKPQGIASFNDEEDYYGYDWKIGLSLLDLGANQYKYGQQSRAIKVNNTQITGRQLDNVFDSTVTTFSRFNDSLATLVSLSSPGSQFTVINPTRLVANVDHYLTGNFFINAELSVNVPLSWLKKGSLQLKQLNLLTVTPRWERRRLGFYLPIQFNNRNQFWVGGAVKAGPLLFGFHNLVNLFGKTSVQNGGGYIALVIRAFNGRSAKTDRRLNCPKPIW